MVYLVTVVGLPLHLLLPAYTHLSGNTCFVTFVSFISFFIRVHTFPFPRRTNYYCILYHMHKQSPAICNLFNFTFVIYFYSNSVVHLFIVTWQQLHLLLRVFELDHFPVRTYRLVCVMIKFGEIRFFFR